MIVQVEWCQFEVQYVGCVEIVDQVVFFQGLDDFVVLRMCIGDLVVVQFGIVWVDQFEVEGVVVFVYELDEQFVEVLGFVV